MIRSLEFLHIGPAHYLGPLTFADRLNVFVGDNGTGKTFLLDCAWWALTGSWPQPENVALPTEPELFIGGTAVYFGTYDPNEEALVELTPTIISSIAAKTTMQDWTSQFDFRTQQWPLPPGRPSNPGLVLYFRVDGQFSLWDPTLHYWKKNQALKIDTPERPDALSLSGDDIWNTVQDQTGKVVCRGIVEDVVSWQRGNAPEFELFVEVLKTLSPQEVVVGQPRQVWLDDRREHPVLSFAYGDVPLKLLSAGQRRLLQIAYLLVWSWKSHQSNAALTRQPVENRVTILFDEPETHLHPQWQRRILPGLLRALELLSGKLEAQVLMGTHSPLVLASLEGSFDADRDTLFQFSRQANGESSVDAVPWAARGDVSAWLTSDVFGLEQARSVEAEKAIEDAERFMRDGTGDKAEIHARLLAALPGKDRFWPRWIVKAGVTS